MAAICGVYLGLTKEPTTMELRPVRERASSSRILSVVEISADSICMPSRMHSSTMWTLGYDTVPPVRLEPAPGHPHPCSHGALRYNIADN
jgi:hypothetical protein